jgi:tRNA(Ile)-lysidine synthase
VREAAGGLANIDFSHVESLLAFALTAQTGKQLDLPLGVRAMKEPGRVVLTIVPQSSPSPFEVAAIIPGVTELPDGSMLIATVILRAEIGDLRQDAGGAVAHLDFARLQTPLTVRSWNRGDRFHPLGAPGTTKLHDFFVNNKVPREQRLRVPLLVSDGRIAWVAGHRIDDRFKVTARTRTVSRIELRPGLHPHPERTGT